MKKCFIIFWVALVLSQSVLCQMPYNSAMQNGYTRKASVSEQVGLTQVTIAYHRPAVKGREGKIWGGVVQKGFTDQGFGNRRPAPWRAGANENTLIEFDHNVKVEGQPLEKGKYAFFVAYDSSESILIFSRKTDAWGSFFYDAKDDALRVKVKPQPTSSSVENLKFEFTDQTPNSAVVVLAWEKKAIPFKIEVDHLKQQFEALVAESENPRGFTSQGLTMAAAWCLQNKYELEKGLEWASLATGPSFPGDPVSFSALSTKAALLESLGKTDEATAVVKTALPFGSVGQLQQLGRQLLATKKLKTALEVFEFSYKKNPDQFITLVGMARGSSANGNFAKAIEYANKALALSPNEANKAAVEAMVEKLKANKDIN